MSLDPTILTGIFSFLTIEDTMMILWLRKGNWLNHPIPNEINPLLRGIRMDTPALIQLERLVDHREMTHLITQVSDNAIRALHDLS